MASLKEIAAELGISYTLVSKVLNGRMGTTGASKATREAILRKARQLNYQPNRVAVALKTGIKGAIGVFLHGMGEPGTELLQDYLKGVAGALENSTSRLLLRFFITDEDFIAACDDNLKRDVDGLVIAGVDHPGLLARLVKMDREGLPVISCFCGLPNKDRRLNVAVDYEAQCYLPTKHLLEKGCRRIAHFRAHDFRYKGFIRAHKEAGVPIDPKLMFESLDSFSIRHGEKFAQDLIKSGVPFDGLVAEADTQAIGAMQAFLKHGLRIPEDVKVTGVDNSPLARACFIPLTSTTAEMTECGRLAVETLKKKINGQPVESITVMPRLVIRASSG